MIIDASALLEALLRTPVAKALEDRLFELYTRRICSI